MEIATLPRAGEPLSARRTRRFSDAGTAGECERRLELLVTLEDTLSAIGCPEQPLHKMCSSHGCQREVDSRSRRSLSERRTDSITSPILRESSSISADVAGSRLSRFRSSSRRMATAASGDPTSAWKARMTVRSRSFGADSARFSGKTAPDEFDSERGDAVPNAPPLLSGDCDIAGGRKPIQRSSLNYFFLASARFAAAITEEARIPYLSSNSSGVPDSA